METNNSPPISFEKAIEEAQNNLKRLYPKSHGSQLEQAVIGKDKKTYEITFSFYTTTTDELSISEKTQMSSAFQLFQAMDKHRRIKKIFLIDLRTGAFKGLKESNK